MMDFLQPKVTFERRFATMDFTAQLAAIGTGISVIAIATSVAVLSGSDGNAGALFDGGPLLSGAIVGQWLKGGVANTIYVITWTVTCSDGSVIERQRRLSVVDTL